MIQDMQISPTDIIPLVNKAWDVSFARVEKNKKAIYERGWFPFNMGPGIRVANSRLGSQVPAPSPNDAYCIFGIVFHL